MESSGLCADSGLTQQRLKVLKLTQRYKERFELTVWPLCVLSAQVQSTSWMPHQQYVMQPTVSILLLRTEPVKRRNGNISECF